MKQVCMKLAALWIAALTVNAAVPPPEKLLPDDTLGVLTVPEYASAKKAWQQTPALQLWNDPSLKAFKEKLVGKLRSDVLGPLEKEFGVKLSDYSGLAQGQVTLALTRNGWDSQPNARPGFVLLADVRDHVETLTNAITDLRKKWVENGKQLRTQPIRDVEFTTFIFSSDDFSQTLKKVFPSPNEGWETLDAPKPKKPGRKIEWMVGQSGSLLIVGNSAKDIEKVLVRQSGGGVAALADKPSFSSSFNQQFRGANCYGWLDLGTVLGVITKQAKTEGDAEAAPRRRGGALGLSSDKFLSSLGLTALKTLTFSEKESPDGSRYEVHVNVPESERKGLIKILSFERRDSAPPPFVPADAVKFNRVRINLPKAIDTLEKALTEAIPQFAGVIKMVVDNAGKDKDPNFDLRQQLFANLGDDVINYEKLPRKQTLEDLNSPPSLTLIGSPRPAELAAAMRALSGLMPQQSAKVREREFLGRTVYSISLPNTSGRGGGAPSDRMLHYAASGGYVAMSTDVGMLEEYLRSNVSNAKPLRDTPGLADAAQKIGGMSTGLFGYENQRETTRAMVETLKKQSGSLATLFSSSQIAGRLGLNESPNALKEWVDFSLLPPFDQIAKYFDFSVWTGGANAEGLTFKFFNPMPPQLRK